jgi:hypothetical protein
MTETENEVNWKERKRDTNEEERGRESERN